MSQKKTLSYHLNQVHSVWETICDAKLDLMGEKGQKIPEWGYCIVQKSRIPPPSCRIGTSCGELRKFGCDQHRIHWTTRYKPPKWKSSLPDIWSNYPCPAMSLSQVANLVMFMSCTGHMLKCSRVILAAPFPSGCLVVQTLQREGKLPCNIVQIIGNVNNNRLTKTGLSYSYWTFFWTNDFILSKSFMNSE